MAANCTFDLVPDQLDGLKVRVKGRGEEHPVLSVLCNLGYRRFIITLQSPIPTSLCKIARELSALILSTPLATRKNVQTCIVLVDVLFESSLAK